MSTHVFTPILGKRIRVTEVDNCGRVIAGPDGTNVVTDGFITVNLSSEVEEGTEVILKKANGGICVNEKFSDSFKRFTTTIEFCGVNPDLLAITTNAERYHDAGGDVAGFTVPEGEINKFFALELWTGLTGQTCEEGADDASGYLLLPFIQSGVVGEIVIDGENAVTFSLSGAYTKGGNQWGKGPFNVVYDDDDAAAPLPTALDPLDHLLLMDTGLAVPDDSDGAEENPV